MKGPIEALNKKLTVALAEYLKDFSFITPNRLTLCSFLVSGILAPYLVLMGHLKGASLAVLAGALLDSLDGDIARLRGQATPEGAVLDAVLDRYIDLFILSSMILRDFSIHEESLFWGLLAMVGSTLVPYIRARTEAEGLKSTPTWGSRDVRNILIFVGLLTEQIYWTLIAIAVLSHTSALHRLFYVFKKGGRNEGSSARSRQRQ